MIYLIAAIIPPYAMYKIATRPNIVVSIILCFVFYPLASIHALLATYLIKNNISFTLSRNTTDSKKTIVINGDNSYSGEAVGESNYQKELASIAGEKDSDSKYILKKAIIKQEPSNPFDSNACAVFIDDLKVGYLPRDTAKRVVKRIQSKGYPDDAQLEVKAVIDGGWKNRRTGDEGHFGVKLDMGSRLTF